MKVPDYSKKVKQLTYLEMQKEIERLTAESTKWESKFYDEAKKVDKAIEYIEKGADFKSLYFIKGQDEEMWKILLSDEIKGKLLEILKGDK